MSKEIKLSLSHKEIHTKSFACF